MRTTHRILLVTAAAVALPTLAVAQDVDIDAEIVPLDGWASDDLYATGISLDEMIGADVNGPTGEDIGDVENVLFDQEGRAVSVIAEIGGFLELGDTHVNIPWDQVEVMEGGDEIMIPMTQETIEDYTLFTDEVIRLGDVGEVQQVSGDNAGVVATGPELWRATDLVGDYARLRDGEGWANYGYVEDAIVRDGQIVAVIASADVTWGAPGYYAYPYNRGGWAPGTGFYDLPYDRTEIEGLEPLDPEMIDD